MSQFLLLAPDLIVAAVVGGVVGSQRGDGSKALPSWRRLSSSMALSMPSVSLRVVSLGLFSKAVPRLGYPYVSRPLRANYITH
jgi:hypothetical protein